MADQDAITELRMLAGELDIINTIWGISKMISSENRIRFLITKCRVRRKTVEETCDLSEEDAFERMDEHLGKMEANELTRFLKSYAPKMHSNTQAMLEECEFQPDEFQLNQCIYNIIDAIPENRKDFLSKMGIASVWKPLKDRSLTRRDFQNVLKRWWTDQAKEDPDKLVQLVAAARSFDGDP